jgi:hypothetical protein
VSDLWFEASRDVEAETATRALTTAKIATVGVWPFLSVAESDEEFELRLDYAMPRLASLVEGDTLDALLASLREDWKALRDFPEGARSPHTASSDDDDDEGDPDCDEFREDGSCIHSDHMAQADAKKYRSEKKANMANTSIEDEAAAEQDSEPEGDLDHLAASLHILRITTASGSAVVIVDSATGRKVGGPYPDRPTAEQAIASGKGNGHNVKIVSAEDHAKSKKKKAAQEPPPFL